MPTDMTGRRGAVTSSTGIGGVTLGVDDAITAPGGSAGREEGDASQRRRTRSLESAQRQRLGDRCWVCVHRLRTDAS